MSDAFIYFWIIGAGLTLGVLSVLAPAYYFYKKKSSSTRGRRVKSNV